MAQDKFDDPKKGSQGYVEPVRNDLPRTANENQYQKDDLAVRRKAALEQENLTAAEQRVLGDRTQVKTPNAQDGPTPAAPPNTVETPEGEVAADKAKGLPYDDQITRDEAEIRVDRESRDRAREGTRSEGKAGRPKA